MEIDNEPKRSGRGGRREGAGRPLKAGEVRKQRQLRATTDEWELIQRLAKLVKYGDKEACIKFLDEQEQIGQK